MFLNLNSEPALLETPGLQVIWPQGLFIKMIVPNHVIPCQIQLFKREEKQETEENYNRLFFEARSVLYLLGVGLDHDVAVDKDRADDGAGEEGVGKHVDRDPDDEDVEEEDFEFRS